jgi:hypothetical protein
MKKETITLLFFSLCTCALFASNIVDPFWQENFNSSFPVAWSTGDGSNQGVLWARCDNPNICVPALYGDAACRDAQFRSTSFQDGYMYVDSYIHGNISFPSQSYLRTSVIDCSDKDAVFIKFETYINAFTKDPDVNAVLKVKSGSSPYTTFTIFPLLNNQTVSRLKSWNAQTVLLDISSVAANKPDVVIEWYWSTKSDIAWMIDDIALFDENPTYDNVVWGQNAGQGDFLGGSNGWSVTNQLDSCKWSWTDNPAIYLVGNSGKAHALACWSGVNNGAMIMNASYCYLQGNASQFSRSDLKSPSINLSSIPPNTPLDLKFDQVLAAGNPASSQYPVASVSISIDNGLTVLENFDVNPNHPFLLGKCGEARFRLPKEVAGKSQVRLTFIFSGDTHYWMVDNIRIALADDRDMELSPDFYNVARDFSVPGSQVTPIALHTQLKNNGNLPMSGVKAYARALDFDGVAVFTDSIEIGTVDAGDIWLDINFPHPFTPSSQPEEYTIWYEVTSNDEDEFPANNRAHWKYKVTENVFSKNEFCSTSNGYFFSTESDIYEIGNCYYIPKGSNLRAVSLSFAFKNDVNLAAGNAQLSTRLYEWRNGDNYGDENKDSMANFNEYNLIAYNSYNVQGGDGGTIITVPFSEDSDTTLLKDDTYYFATVGYLEPVIVANQVQKFPIAGSEEINFSAMYFNTYNSGIRGYTSMLREGSNSYDFRVNAWGLTRIPFVNLNVEPFVNANSQVLGPASELKLFPNPASTQILLTADFLGLNQPVQVEIFDLCGRLVKRQEFPKGNVSQLPIDIYQLSNGSYNLRVISGSNLAGAKLMVVH